MASGCIYIDDAGNPGTESGSDYLSSSRKSWTAVIVPASIANAVEMSMALFLKGVNNEFDRRSRWWVPSKNHHPDLTITEPQFFTSTGPNRETHAGIKKALQRFNAHEGLLD